VTKLECPSSLLIVSRSTPASSMLVAKLCRIVWGVAALRIPARAIPALHAFWTVYGVMGNLSCFRGGM
jgi:hypothetical protein